MIAGVLVLALLQDPARLTISDVVDRALASHPSVAAARALRDRAAAETGEARSTQLPRIAVDASVNRFQEPMVVAPLHGFDVRQPPLFDRMLVQSGIALNWTVLDFGSRARHVRAQRFLEDAADYAVSAAEQDLIARAVTAYLTALATREVVAAQDQRLAALAAEARRVRQLLAEGKAARVSGLRIDAEERRASADRIAAVSRLRAAESELAQLTGLPLASLQSSRLAALRLRDTTLATDTSENLRNRLITEGARSSARVREMAERTRAASAGVVALQRTVYPELRLTSGYVDRGRWWGDYAAEWQVGVSISYTLFGGGREASIRKASADERAAGEQLRLATLSLATAVDRALSALREGRARVSALTSAVDQSVEVARIERLALDVGSGTQADFLEAEANLLAARANLIEARHSEIAARVELARIVGELSRGWLTRTLEHEP